MGYAKYVLRILGGFIIGAILFIAGIVMLSWGLKQVENGTIPFYILLSFLSFGVGAFASYKISRSGERKKIERIIKTDKAGNIYLRNNQMLSEYLRNEEKKDKLEMLKFAAEAEENLQKQK